MSFHKRCLMPFGKLIPPFTLTGPEGFKLRQQATRKQSEDLWREFKKARNEVTRQLRTAKALY